MADFQKISEPGVYDIPIEIYHGDPCVGPSISKSGLWLMEQKSPAHYWATSPLNPDRLPVEQKDHFNLGSAAHTLILGELGFREKYAVRPAKWDSWRTNAAKEWRDEMVAAGRMVLTDAQIAAIHGIAKNLESHPEIKQGILRGQIEKSLIWKDAETGVWLRSRPDVIPTDSNIVIDLKTTADASERALMRGFVDHGYHVQLALVAEGFRRVMGREVEMFGLVYAETEPPYVVTVRPVSDGFIYWGSAIARRAIRRFADCLEKDEWPGYPTDGQRIYTPKWLEDRLLEEQRVGELPDPNAK